MKQNKKIFTSRPAALISPMMLIGRATVYLLNVHLLGLIVSFIFIFIVVVIVAGRQIF